MVLRAVRSLSVAPRVVTRTAAVPSAFRQFVLGDRVPIGGFELRVDAGPGQLDGVPVPSAVTRATLGKL